MTDTRSEYEKMLAGDFYLGYAPQLQELQMQARLRLADFNVLRPDDDEGRTAAIKSIFGSVGEHTAIVAPFFVEFGTHIHLGNCFINTGATFLDCNTITIGDFTAIGPNVQFLTPSHPIDPYKRIPKELIDGIPDFSKSTFAKPIKVGDRCWIGAGTIIMPGVTIGDGTTIGAGSVVTRSLPDHVVAMGSPARIVRTFEKP
ncbi:MAG: sugar O-acetyltransferase [Rhizobiales bacterium]|nr:sugar O-acetyltransferase [Hyphomicrobiales bacterium]